MIFHLNYLIENMELKEVPVEDIKTITLMKRIVSFSGEHTIVIWDARAEELALELYHSIATKLNVSIPEIIIKVVTNKTDVER